MAKTRPASSPWATGNEPIEIIALPPIIKTISQAHSELETAAMQLQLKLKQIPQLDDVLDLFPEIFRRLRHIKADLEDIAAGRPLLHG